MLQCVVVCCSVLHLVICKTWGLCCSVLQCVALCCRVLQCVAFSHLKDLGLMCCRVGVMQVIQACQIHVSDNTPYPCNTMQHKHCDALQHIATHCNTGNRGLPDTRQRDFATLIQRTQHSVLCQHTVIEHRNCQRTKQSKEALLPCERCPASGRRSAWHLVQST